MCDVWVAKTWSTDRRTLSVHSPHLIIFFFLWKEADVDFFFLSFSFHLTPRIRDSVTVRLLKTRIIVTCVSFRSLHGVLLLHPSIPAARNHSCHCLLLFCNESIHYEIVPDQPVISKKDLTFFIIHSYILTEFNLLLESTFATKRLIRWKVSRPCLTSTRLRKWLK